MTSEEFVKAVKAQTSDASVEGTIRSFKHPPGRKPSERLRMLSNWYNQLAEEDQNMLREALREAAEMAVFEFFCVLDGVSAIEDTPDKGELAIRYSKAGVSNLLNDPRGQELHNLFNALCPIGPESQGRKSEVAPYESSSAADLKSALKSADEFDIHHIPDKYSSLQRVKDYDPNVAPAIAVPKAEHRQIRPEK